eukprot:CAMPEP_0177661594 /NCGR_PEP_ID=MMETSP0447-20121125/18786_1 /TAXON_ID=0 /ORGANISM="Stygamoeba regulata, Strain BSH-02190019" /LENGTH=510 /DNA_ID=CAMNT_0019166995 /DNA_START=35 /DNA_END=1564 /DNA_ORIENTATION=+
MRLLSTGLASLLLLLALLSLCVICPAETTPPRLHHPYVSKEQYLVARAKLVAEQKSYAFDANVTLNADEIAANAILHSIQLEDFKLWSSEGLETPPSHNFFHARSLIDRTRIFSLIRQMPKGAILHAHNTALGNFSYLIEKVTYMPNCYMNTNQSSREYQHFYFYPSPPTSDWKLVSELRAAADDVTLFDESLYQMITINQGNDLGNAETVWSVFSGRFGRIHGLVSYLPVFSEWLKDAFRFLIRDGVSHIELRTSPHGVYALNGTVYDSVFTTQLLQQAAADIRREYPFFTLRMIYATSRTSPETRVLDSLNEALSLRERWPDFVLGFDLVGNEYTGHSLLYYLDDFIAFQNVSDQSAVGLPYYFHAGESMYSSNTNLYDAILLQTRRIGHGFALSKFEPVLSKLVRERQICLEVCPISNQVLKLVEDLRNHPAVNFLHLDIPMVISTDDAGLMTYNLLSYDFYEAYMAFGLDIAGLKKLIFNSIHYSGLFSFEKEILRQTVQAQWEKW